MGFVALIWVDHAAYLLYKKIDRIKTGGTDQHIDFHSFKKLLDWCIEKRLEENVPYFTLLTYFERSFWNFDNIQRCIQYSVKHLKVHS